MSEDNFKKDIDYDKVAEALSLNSKVTGGNKCPNCNSFTIRWDSPGTFCFLFSLLLLPFSLIFLISNRNRYCDACGMRFKKIGKFFRKDQNFKINN